MAPHDDHDQFYNQLVPSDDKEWITNIRKNKRSLLSHGLSNDHKKLELRLGPPGDHHHHEDKGSPFDDQSERINHVNWLRTTFQCNTNIGQTAQQYLSQQVLEQPTKPSLNIISQKPSCGFLVNWDHDHHHQLQISDQNKKPCPVPAATSTVSKFANSSVPNCSNKRSTTTIARRGSVVGWPPIRSCRKNLNGSNSLSKTVPLSITNNNYDHSGDEFEKEVVLLQQDQGKRSSEDHDHHMFVKINMEGVPIGRKVDLKAYDSYEKLSYAIDQLFRGLLAARRDYSVSESNEQTGDHAKTATNIGEYTLVYEDNEGDRMLVGDVPWKMFVSTAKRLRVLRSTELSTLKRTLWMACAHIITRAIGAGVLSLARAMSQLGWTPGVGMHLLFSAVSLYSGYLLADCYGSPAPVTGKRNYSYVEAVKTTLGGTMCMICGWIQYGNLTSIVIGFTITTAKSLVAMHKSYCHRRRGSNAPCKFSDNPHIIGLGIVEIFLSQIANFHKLSWISAVAAIMSFAYSITGIGLSTDKIVKGRERKTSLFTGVHGDEVGLSAADKVWRMFTAAGDTAFACIYGPVFIDIQDTLNSSPAENKVMKRASRIAVSVMTAFFVMCGCLGYAAFGDHAPENLLAGFGFHQTSWIIDLANFFIVVHLVGAYQVLAQPVFRAVETWASMRWPNSGFITSEYTISMYGKRLIPMNLFRLTWRTIFVVMVTVIAMALPFFTHMIALMGAIGYWPLVVHFPVEMHIAQNKIPKRTMAWAGLQLLSLMTFLISLAAASGAIQGIHKNLHTYQPFKSTD